MNRLLVATLAILMLVGPAEAYIPPGPPPPEVGWKGPGVFCGEGYTLTVEAGEFIREDLQLELWYPLSNTVKSARGWYSISVFVVGPRPRDHGALVSRDDRGALYEADERPHALRSFVYFPTDEKLWPVRIEFWKPESGDDWRARPPATVFTPEESRGVLNRIVFGAACPPSCLSGPRTAGECRP